jgi:hypothetical protein
MTWCRYHCRRCGSHFTSLEGFDHHHGSEPCSFPDGFEFVETAGTCTVADPTAPTTGTVYSTGRASRAAEYFHPTNGPQTARAERIRPRMIMEVAAG